MRDAKEYVLIAAATAACVIAITPAGLAWGISAHQIITYNATSMLDEPLKGFFEANMESLLAFSIEPDLLAATDPAEGVNHFINLDAFDRPPFDRIPADREAFAAEFGEDALSNGRLPWAAQERYEELVNAFREKDLRAILSEAGYLSHYLGDATMPLHTTINYRGQYSGNVIFDTDAAYRHVHVRFEVGMIDQHRTKIKKRAALLAQPLRTIEAPAAEALELAKVAYSDIDAILAADRSLMQPGQAPERDYYAGLHERVGDIAERQLATAASAVASFWQSAWQEAGSPAFLPGEVVMPAGSFLAESRGRDVHIYGKGDLDD